MKATWAVGALALGLTAPAESFDWWGRDDRYYRRDAGRIAYDRGFEDGAKDGSNDGRKGRYPSLSRHDDYRDADDGYRRSYGPRYVYQRAYRRGYEEGYRRGFASRAYGRYGYGGRYGYDPYGRGRAQGRYDGRHRHAGLEGWCYERHDDYRGDDDRTIHELPPRW